MQSTNETNAKLKTQNSKLPDRYSRQTILPQIGREGQDKLRAATVVIAGVGALGSSMAELLARAGVGTLRLADRDYLELHNLQRQSLYTEADIESGLPKAAAASKHLTEINSEVNVEPWVIDITPENILDLLSTNPKSKIQNRGVRWHRQPPDPLPAERCLHQAGHTLGIFGRGGRERGELDRRAGGECLPALPLSRYARCGYYRDVRRSGRAGSSRSCYGCCGCRRSHQADCRRRSCCRVAGGGPVGG